MATRYCEYCGKPIPVGSDVFSSDLTDRYGQPDFCTGRCMKEYIRANLLDDILDDWLENNMDVSTAGADDPYDRYGVYESDF